MARPRASDHDEKRQAILNRSADLFAAHGYDRVSVSMLTRACHMSKALMYHYFADKSEILFEIIHSHLKELLAATESPIGPEPREQLLSLAQSLLETYRSADSQHHVQINQMHLLPRTQQKLLKNLERELVQRFADAIARCLPATAQYPTLVTPLTMSMFGMLNWSHLWFRANGSLTRAEYARLVTTLIIDGAENFVVTPSPNHRAPVSLNIPDLRRV